METSQDEEKGHGMGIKGLKPKKHILQIMPPQTDRYNGLKHHQLLLPPTQASCQTVQGEHKDEKEKKKVTNLRLGHWKKKEAFSHRTP